MDNQKKWRVSLATHVPMNFEATVEAHDAREAYQKAYEAFDNRDWESVEGYIDEDNPGEAELDLSDPDNSDDPWNPDGTSGVFVEEITNENND